MFSDETPWEFQEQIERSLLYGKPKNLDELFRYLIPNENGLWEHKLISKDDIQSISKLQHKDLQQAVYCIIWENDNNRSHTQKQNKFDNTFHSKNYEDWPSMNEDLICRTAMNNDWKCIKMDTMTILNNSKLIKISNNNEQLVNLKSLSKKLKNYFFKTEL